MATLGPNDLKQFAVPAGWDAGRMTALRLATGETYEQFVSDVAGALAIANAGLLKDRLVSGLVSVTSEDAVEYRMGVSNGFGDFTDYSQPDAGRGATRGHMLPLKAYDRKLGWTWAFLRKARRAQLDADISSAMADLRDLWQKKVLTRHFRSTYEAVGLGKSYPYADGGTADSGYVPPHNPEREATAFTTAHNHYQRLNGITQANLETAVEHVWEHGHDGPFDLLVAQADIASWQNTTNVTGWIKRADSAIRYGVEQDLANVADDYLGVVETKFGACRLRATARIPTNYWTVYKSYGAGNPGNPLRVRESLRYGLGAVLLAGDHIREYPLENCILFFEFGVGVGEDRCAAVCVFNHDDNNYVDPTIA